jgi:hypothetical protein
MKKTTKKKPLVCVIDRALWARGGNQGNIGTGLRNPNGTMCCLGFLGKTCGVSEENLGKVSIPESLPDEDWKLFPRVHGQGWDPFIGANDRRNLTPAYRENKLRALAKKNGFRFRFVGKES